MNFSLNDNTVAGYTLACISFRNLNDLKFRKEKGYSQHHQPWVTGVCNGINDSQVTFGSKKSFKEPRCVILTGEI